MKAGSSRLSWVAFFVLFGTSFMARGDTPTFLPERYIEVVLGVEGMV